MDSIRRDSLITRALDLCLEIFRKQLGLRNSRGPRFQKLLFAVDQCVDVVGGEFDAVAMRNRVCGTRFDAISAENAARVIYIVDLRVTFTGGNSLSVGVFRGFDVDTIRGASSGAKKASDTFFEAVFIALKHVYAPIARLNCWRSVGKTFSGGLLEHRSQGDAEALDERDKCFASFLNDVWHREITLTNLEHAGNGR
jgi:hypothetical protein